MRFEGTPKVMLITLRGAFSFILILSALKLCLDKRMKNLVIPERDNACIHKCKIRFSFAKFFATSSLIL